MDHSKDIESTLDALLLNATLQKETPSCDLSDQQKRLLDNLLDKWNKLTEQEKNDLINANIETKVHELSKKNKACLRKVQPRSRLSHKTVCASPKQLDFML